jgi:hypothetical protein
MSACIAVTIQYITAFSSMVWKKFIGCLQYDLTFTTSSITFWEDFCCSSFFLTTLLASVSQSIPPFFLGNKEIFGFREKEFTVFALLLGDALDAWCVKIECALSNILRYTIVHNGNHLSVITAPVVSATRGQKHGQFNLINYSINPLQKQAYSNLSCVNSCVFQ